MEEKFNDILDNDEHIKKVFKPRKSKMMFSALIYVNLPLLLISVLMIVSSVFPSNFESFVSRGWLFGTLLASLFVLANIITVFCVHFVHKNLYYAYSNKRLIIRRGVWGIDYKCLDLSLIGAQDVSVTWLDKFIKKNTGSLRFGSLARPVGSNGSIGDYKFSHIENPYGTYRELKEEIDNARKK